MVTLSRFSSVGKKFRKGIENIFASFVFGLSLRDSPRNLRNFRHPPTVVTPLIDDRPNVFYRLHDLF